MDKFNQFDYGDIDGSQVLYTGINGFLNVETKEVVFCPRVFHISTIQSGQLPGLRGGGTMYRGLAKGGARWGRDEASLDDIYFWAALHNWVHFIADRDVTPAEVHFRAASKGQESVAKRFSLEWGVTPVFLCHPSKEAEAAIRSHYADNGSNLEAAHDMSM